MKAVAYTYYRPPEVLHLKEVEKPLPAENEILIKIHAVAVNYGDIIARNFKNLPLREFNMPLPLWLPSRMIFGFRKPKKNILGSQFSGEIEATGKNVKRFQKGDQVFGYRGQKMGTYAEYLCMSENENVAIKPANMNFQEASAVPYGTLMALNLLKKVNIKPGHKMLIIGASGGIGSAALQLAKYHYGAKITGVCSTQGIAYLTSLGADRVVDYKSENFTKSGETYDVIMDILGRSTFPRVKPLLKPDGIYFLTSFKMKHIFQMLWTKIRGGKRVICALAAEKPDDLNYIREIVEAGKIKTVIDRHFLMGQAAEAHRYIEEGNKKGNVVLVMGND